MGGELAKRSLFPSCTPIINVNIHKECLDLIIGSSKNMHESNRSDRINYVPEPDAIQSSQIQFIRERWIVKFSRIPASSSIPDSILPRGTKPSAYGAYKVIWTMDGSYSRKGKLAIQSEIKNLVDITQFIDIL